MGTELLAKSFRGELCAAGAAAGNFVCHESCAECVTEPDGVWCDHAVLTSANGTEIGSGSLCLRGTAFGADRLTAIEPTGPGGSPQLVQADCMDPLGIPRSSTCATPGYVMVVIVPMIVLLAAVLVIAAIVWQTGIFGLMFGRKKGLSESGFGDTESDSSDSDGFGGRGMTTLTFAKERSGSTITLPTLGAPGYGNSRHSMSRNSVASDSRRDVAAVASNRPATRGSLGPSRTGHEYGTPSAAQMEEAANAFYDSVPDEVVEARRPLPVASTMVLAGGGDDYVRAPGLIQNDYARPTGLIIPQTCDYMRAPAPEGGLTISMGSVYIAPPKEQFITWNNLIR